MSPVKIQCPVKGTWMFMNPPGHHPDAKDFVAVDNSGKPYQLFRLLPHLFFRLNVKNTYAFSQPVFAPFSGVIVKIENKQPDRQSLNLISDCITGLLIAPRKHKNDPEYFLGNHLIIKSDDGIYALFAHLKENSIVLEEAMRVRAGEKIAEVGNSGNTIQSHLHFHLMHDNDPFSSIPLPFVIDTFELKKQTGWEKEHLSLPENFMVFRTYENSL